MYSIRVKDANYQEWTYVSNEHMRGATVSDIKDKKVPNEYFILSKKQAEDVWRLVLHQNKEGWRDLEYLAMVELYDDTEVMERSVIRFKEFK